MPRRGNNEIFHIGKSHRKSTAIIDEWDTGGMRAENKISKQPFNTYSILSFDL
jgi:hypothetical protein